MTSIMAVMTRKQQLQHKILIVCGATLRAEEMDRRLAYRIADEVSARLQPPAEWQPLVISDILYLNDSHLSAGPLICIGGPGVNSLSGILYHELPSVLTIDNTLIIQMDPDGRDLRCCLWGMDHEQTVRALELFLERGHLDYFLEQVIKQGSQA